MASGANTGSRGRACGGWQRGSGRTSGPTLRRGLPSRNRSRGIGLQGRGQDAGCDAGGAAARSIIRRRGGTGATGCAGAATRVGRATGRSRWGPSRRRSVSVWSGARRGDERAAGGRSARREQLARTPCRRCRLWTTCEQNGLRGRFFSGQVREAPSHRRWIPYRRGSGIGTTRAKAKERKKKAKAAAGAAGRVGVGDIRPERASGRVVSLGGWETADRSR